MVEQRRPADTVSTRMTYDALGRLISSQQPHHVHASSTTYTAGKNQVISRSDAAGAVTSYGYFPQGSFGAGRVASVTYADATVRRSAYDIRGNMTNEWGSATAPTSYTFDAYNQMETLATYRTAITADSVVFPTTVGTADVTTWVRQEATGLLTQKKYADNKGPVYLYDIAGRLTRRTTARGTVTDYAYTAWGQPDVTNYADTTPDADIDYDRMGRKTRESNGTATSSYQYSATTLRPTLETLSYDLNRDGTPELIRQLDRSHDNLRRPTGFTLKDGTTTETAASYGYDPYSRLSQISNPQLSNQIFTYSYLQNSSLLAAVTGPVHTVTNTWELDRDVLDAKENKVGGVTVSKLDYVVNAIGQRTALSQTGTSFASVRGIAWAYDTYGQVTSADSTLAAQDRAYQYDAIGNRKKSANSLTLPVADNYQSNALNQYSTIQQGGTGVSPVYDPDGNATAYPLPSSPTVNSTLTYDSENRLTSTTVNGITTTQQFDATGRRISKTTGTNTRLYLYDGWNVIAEYSRSVGVSPTLQKTYLWGTDLSGSMQGAGGVGGLLLITDHSALITSHYPTYDGNGNISEYLTPTGTIAAHFEYDAFGNTTVNTDTGNQFTYKFSTKPQDIETGLYYYGYRYYDSVAGRWINRDPIEDNGGLNLYTMVWGDPVNSFDYLGLVQIEGWTIIGTDVNGKDVYENNITRRRFQVDFEKVWNDSGGYTIERKVREVKPDGTGWDAATRDLISWLTANTPKYTGYGEADNEVQQIKQSGIAAQLRQGYQSKFANTKCSAWGDYTNVKLDFGISEFFNGLGNGRAHFVGSGRGDAFSVEKDDNTCKVKVKFVITNTTSLKSALYHLIPNNWNRSGPEKIGSNWIQTYTWHEEFKCNKN